MKRLVVSATMDDVGSVVADITSVVEDYFETYEGIPNDEAQEYYRVEVDDFQYKNSDVKAKKITLYAEMSLEDFYLAEKDLNEAVQKLDSDAYFEPVTAGEFICIVVLDRPVKKEDRIFNHKNIDHVVESVARQLGKALDEEFTVTEVDIADPYYVSDEDYDEDMVRIFVSVESDSYESLAYVDFYKSEVVSSLQVKMDLVDQLYSKLVNSVVSK